MEDQRRQTLMVLTSLQAGRGLAAMLVVLFHLNGLFASGKHAPASAFPRLFEMGHAGVMFFFVLSGFIIAHAHARDIGRQGALPTYTFRRVTRIYPVYWLILAPLAVVYFAMPSLGQGWERDPLVLLSSFMLVHLTDATVLNVAWTLYHEILFYALFGIVIVWPRLGCAALGAWFIGSILVDDPFALAQLNALFGMGIAVAWLARAGRIPAPRVLLWGGLIAFGLAGLLEVYADQRNLVLGYGAAGAAIIAGAVELERSGRLRVNRAWQLLGDASYVLYLIHYPLLSLLARLFVRLPALVSAVLMLIVVTGAAIAVHLWVEKPLLRRMHRKPRTALVPASTCPSSIASRPADQASSPPSCTS